MENIKELKNYLSSPKDIVITSHRNPDGDAIGSSLGLFHFLRKWGHTVHIIVPSDFPEFLAFLKDSDQIIVYDEDPVYATGFVQKADLIFCLDFNSLDRIDKLGEAIEPTQSLKVMIDHHLYPQPFAEFILSDTTASSTCELVYRFIHDLGAKKDLDPIIGECLFTGILTDTGSFKYSTSARLFRIVADLLELGVDDYRIQDLVFNSLKEKHLRILGHVLNRRLQILPEYKTAIITLTKKDYEYFDIQRGDTEGLVNQVLQMRDVKIAAFIHEQPTITKISLRSKGDFSVQEIASKYFRGGGHKNAAGGFSYYGLKATVKKFIEVLPEFVKPTPPPKPASEVKTDLLNKN
ncbi:MAG: bifunctional oligoribonuclease/PAP phosphatase NrnA [Bacteroidetes bacterium]|nr:MAG: bifunctional oligoribonuclease/PAP phosphatase NrnA [Bacteroidota bacterium]